MLLCAVKKRNMDKPQKKKSGSALFALLVALASSSVVFFIVLLTLPCQRGIAFAGLILFLALFFLSMLGLYLLRDKKKGRILFISVFTALSALATFLVNIAVLPSAMLFYPNRFEEGEKLLAEEASVTQITIQDAKGTYSGYMENEAGEEKAPLILYFGGNGECSARRINNLRNMEKYRVEEKKKTRVFEGYRFAFIDYPGYGRSSGVTKDSTMKDAALACYDYFAGKEYVSSIHAFGYSIGTGVANYLASRREVKSLTLFAPYKTERTSSTASSMSTTAPSPDLPLSIWMPTNMPRKSRSSL